MPVFISTPLRFASKQHQVFHYGMCELIGDRKDMEDALMWEPLKRNALKSFTPEEIGHRLWTTYMMLDYFYTGKEDGSTASSVVYDGQGNFIVATLGDSLTFAAVYDLNGQVLGVTRLNKMVHAPSNPHEQSRILDSGDYPKATMLYGRVCYKPEQDVTGRGQSLSLTRAIGDRRLKEAGLIAAASIDIESIESIANRLKIGMKEIGSIKIITTCDGYTESVDFNAIRVSGHTKRERHENYLHAMLATMSGPYDEASLAESLACAAYHDGSEDNISVSIMTIPFENDTPQACPFLKAVFDGHGGRGAAHFSAQYMSPLFYRVCQLSKEEYQRHPLSIFNHAERFNTDHPTTPVEEKRVWNVFLSWVEPSISRLSVENFKTMIYQEKFFLNKLSIGRKLSKYIHQIERLTHDAHIDVMATKYNDFSFFTHSRSINRNIHYKLAIELLKNLRVQNTMADAYALFEMVSIESSRKNIRNTANVPHNHVYRGLCYSRLRAIVQEAKTCFSVKLPSEEVNLELVTTSMLFTR